MGHNCKYNGGNNYNEEVCDFYENHSCVSVCPEGSSGLPTPRPPAEYVGMRILDREGTDVTEAFERGAALSLERAFDEAGGAAKQSKALCSKPTAPPAAAARSTTELFPADWSRETAVLRQSSKSGESK